MTLRERIALIEDDTLREEILATVNPTHNTLDVKVDDFTLLDVIGGAFVWSETPQGHDYWSALAKKIATEHWSALAKKFAAEQG